MFRKNSLNNITIVLLALELQEKKSARSELRKVPGDRFPPQTLLTFMTSAPDLPKVEIVMSSDL